MGDANEIKSLGTRRGLLLCRLQLRGELVDGGYIIEGREIGVAGEGVAFLAVDQNFYFQNAGSVGGDGVDQRRDGQILDQHAGAVRVGKGAVQVNDGDSGIDQKDTVDVGAGAKNVGRGLVEIARQQGPQKFFGTLLASGGQRNQGELGAQGAIVGPATGGAKGRVSVEATGVAAAVFRMFHA